MLKSTVDQQFRTPNGKVIGVMRRNFKMDFVPILHSFLEDSAWNKEKKISDIIINPIGGFYMLRVEDEIIDTDESFTEIAKMYQAQGWEKI